jgi:hypothetical protein
MATPERWPHPLRLWPEVWLAIVLLVPIAVSTLKFGRPFLVQFFMNPFQMFIVIPWALSYFCVRKGFMPLKGGGKIQRATNPVKFWISVGLYALIGTIFFTFNLWLSWQVLSRPDRAGAVLPRLSSIPIPIAARLVVDNDSSRHLVFEP